VVHGKKKGAGKAPTTSQEIECKFREMTEFGSVLPEWNPDNIKLGRYSGCRWSKIPKNKYPVLARVDGDFEALVDQGMSNEDIAWGCINFLNVPPPRKKYAKRTPKPLYGTLSLIRFFCRRNEYNKVYFEMVLSTDHKKSRYFWGSGC